jgi:Acyl carrier protein
LKLKIKIYGGKFMTKEEVYENLLPIFQNVFDDDSLKISDETTANDIEDWDSLEQINLIVAIEKKFNIKFDISEVGKMQNVGKMVISILGKVN